MSSVHDQFFAPLSSYRGFQPEQPPTLGVGHVTFISEALPPSRPISPANLELITMLPSPCAPMDFSTNIPVGAFSVIPAQPMIATFLPVARSPSPFTQRQSPPLFIPFSRSPSPLVARRSPSAHYFQDSNPFLSPRRSQSPQFRHDMPQYDRPIIYSPRNDAGFRNSPKYARARPPIDQRRSDFTPPRERWSHGMPVPENGGRRRNLVQASQEAASARSPSNSPVSDDPSIVLLHGDEERFRPSSKSTRRAHSSSRGRPPDNARRSRAGTVQRDTDLRNSRQTKSVTRDEQRASEIDRSRARGMEQDGPFMDRRRQDGDDKPLRQQRWMPRSTSQFRGPLENEDIFFETPYAGNHLSGFGPGRRMGPGPWQGPGDFATFGPPSPAQSPRAFLGPGPWQGPGDFATFGPPRHAQSQREFLENFGEDLILREGRDFAVPYDAPSDPWPYHYPTQSQYPTVPDRLLHDRFHDHEDGTAGRWRIFGRLAPDGNIANNTTYAYKVSGDKEYLVISNEGDDKNFIWDNFCQLIGEDDPTDMADEGQPDSRNESASRKDQTSDHYTSAASNDRRGLGHSRSSRDIKRTPSSHEQRRPVDAKQERGRPESRGASRPDRRSNSPALRKSTSASRGPAVQQQPIPTRSPSQSRQRPPAAPARKQGTH